mgnify:CR=1 FL=1
MTIKHNSTCRNTCYTQAKCVPKVSTSNNSIGHKPKCSQGLPSTGFNNSSYIQVDSPCKWLTIFLFKYVLFEKFLNCCRNFAWDSLLFSYKVLAIFLLYKTKSISGSLCICSVTSSRYKLKTHIIYLFVFSLVLGMRFFYIVERKSLILVRIS